ncbi:MAG: dihydrofolate reductase family protein [Mucilaginibacter polytrichastri]|nr:dihydrofolate reductase family protein [Mucilaginibacter polytrichastri]
MRKLILQEWMSLDAFAADENGGLDFMSSPDLNKLSDDDQTAMMDGIDLIILGANTYQMFSSYWPNVSAEEEKIADKLNATPKLIFSKTLKEAPWGSWPAADIHVGDAAEKIRELKQQQGKDIVLWGSLSLAHALIRENLIDEYHIRICPAILGKGIPLFPADFAMEKLKHAGTKTYDSGLVLLSYTN